MKRYYLPFVGLTALLVMGAVPLKAQFFKNDSAHTASLFDVNIGLNFPVFQMAKRFGWFEQASIEYKEKLKHNLLVGISAGYQFGSRLRFDPVLSLKDKDSAIYNTNGVPGDVQLTYRGVQALVTIGKMWPLRPSHQNRGIYTEFGLGYWWYHVRINVANKDVAQLMGDNRYGYDRLTTGMPLHQFIGYMHLGELGFSNYFIGFDINEGFNTLQHNYDYNTGTYLSRQLRDITVGFKAGIILPIYHDVSKTVYVN